MNRDQFAQLAVSYLHEMTAFARRLAGSEWDAHDLVQSCYERAFERWQELREPAKCRAWLFRIARNLYLDEKRRARARPELRLVAPEGEGGATPVVPPETVERMTAREIEAALEALPTDQREAVLLADLWGFRYDEIAGIMGTPTGTVRSRIARGRAALAGALASWARLPSGGEGTS